ncbi:MAG: hypothetical protein Q9227_007683 [Pyrenula ochraceoflavens]
MWANLAETARVDDLAIERIAFKCASTDGETCKNGDACVDTDAGGTLEWDPDTQIVNDIAWANEDLLDGDGVTEQLFLTDGPLPTPSGPALIPSNLLGTTTQSPITTSSPPTTTTTTTTTPPTVVTVTETTGSSPPPQTTDTTTTDPSPSPTPDAGPLCDDSPPS